MTVFSSATGVKRPIRLSEATREWCAETLEGKIGEEIKKTPFVTMDDIEGFESFHKYQQFDLCIDRIARESRIFIRENELLVGSATLFSASWAQVPAQYKNNYVMIGTNHTTYNFGKVLKLGLDAYQQEIDERIKQGADDIGMRLLISALSTISSIRVWHSRYMAELENRIANASSESQKIHYTAVRDNLKDMPFKPAKTFRQAMQSLLFTVEFTRLCGNFSGIGKMDRMLEPYLKNDLEKGIITMDGARELMANFFIKAAEWTTLDKTAAGGDGMYFENIVLAGIDAQGNETAGIATSLILETVEELPIGDCPIAVRLNKNSPEWLLRKCAEVTRHGVGVVAVYDEETVIRSLEKMGYPREEAINFSNDGCWEILIEGKTLFGYYPMDAMPALQRDTLRLDKTDEPSRSFDSYQQIVDETKHNIHKMIDHYNILADGWCIRSDNPVYVSGVASLFVDGCIEKATDYWASGPVYANLSPHFGGLGDIANDLYAIKKIVYEQQLLSIEELISILKENWEGHESLMKYFRDTLRYYGNDNDEVDDIMADLVSDFADYTNSCNVNRKQLRRSPGISTFGRQVSEWREERFATASGRQKWDILSGNISPAPMTDYNGPTAIIKSCCKCALDKLGGGTALDINLEPYTIKGEEGVEAIIALYRGFVNLNGYFMHVNVVDPAELEDAVIHPEKHQNLTVRVSGWSSRFITIEASWQKMIIERAKNGLHN